MKDFLKDVVGLIWNVIVMIILLVVLGGMEIKEWVSNKMAKIFGG